MKNKYLVDNFWEEERLEKRTIREGFGEAIVDVAKKNEEIVVLSADLPGSLKLEKFIEVFPAKYLQTGVAEQNMAGIAAGLARYGKLPFVTSFAAFSPGLNYSQIRLSALSKLPVKFVGSHYGLNTGKDGPSAQMLSDVAMMKALPGMVIVNPADYHQALQATWAIAETRDISYLRVTREKFPVFLRDDAEFAIGKAQHLLEGDKLTVIATGSVVYETLQAVKPWLDLGISVDFLNMHTIKPLDEEAIVNSARITGRVAVVEENNIHGGLGESVARVLGEQQPVKLLVLGLKDIIGESGDPWELWKKYGLDRESIRNLLEKFL